MNNTGMQALIDQFGDRIYCINLDNTRFIRIGYRDRLDGTSSCTIKDISLETIGGVDYIVVNKKSRAMGDREITYKVYHLTETVQWVGIMDEDSNDYRPDPLTFA